MRLSMGSRGGGTARSRGDTQRALDEFDELAGLRGAAGDSGSQAERSVYVLEHLATFTVTRETGIVYPADGMRRLLQLEKTNGQYSAGTGAHTAACPRGCLAVPGLTLTLVVCLQEYGAKKCNCVWRVRGYWSWTMKPE